MTTMVMGFTGLFFVFANPIWGVCCCRRVRRVRSDERATWRWPATLSGTRRWCTRTWHRPSCAATSSKWPSGTTTATANRTSSSANSSSIWPVRSRKTWLDYNVNERLHSSIVSVRGFPTGGARPQPKRLSVRKGSRPRMNWEPLIEEKTATNIRRNFHKTNRTIDKNHQDTKCRIILLICIILLIKQTHHCIFLFITFFFYHVISLAELS